MKPAIGACVLIAAAITLVGYAPASHAAPPAVPSFNDVRASFATSESQLLDRNGVVLATLRADRRIRRLDWIALSDLSPAVAATLVAAEDRRFYEHAGVDWPGFASAAWDSIWRTFDGRGARGASTLTMQLAGLLDPALAISGNARTLGQKWDQAQAALALERAWTKPQIIEAYLNLTSYRGELTGIDAAARGLFGKAPAGLDAREAAILVALQRGPNAPAATVAQRACAVAGIAAPQLACEDVRARVGIDRFYDTLRQLGLDSLTEPADFYGASLALGGADVTLLTLANAYRALANGGHWSATRVIAQGADTPTHRVFGRDAAFIIGDILADRGARATSFGLENALATRVWSARTCGLETRSRSAHARARGRRRQCDIDRGVRSSRQRRPLTAKTGPSSIFANRIVAQSPQEPNAPSSYYHHIMRIANRNALRTPMVRTGRSVE
jgi:membrane carboxypeptidase/penicillin-binding protein PbpC